MNTQQTVFPKEMEECVPQPRDFLILCVDDDRAGLTSRSFVLRTAGYDVLIAESGKAGLRLFREHAVDLVITDHFLPDLPGVELIASMKRLKPEVPVILLTGSLESPTGAELADLVIVKGTHPRDFLEQVAKVLSR